MLSDNILFVQPPCIIGGTAVIRNPDITVAMTAHFISQLSNGVAAVAVLAMKVKDALQITALYQFGQFILQSRLNFTHILSKLRRYIGHSQSLKQILLAVAWEIRTVF